MTSWRVGSDIRTWLPRLQAHRGYWVEGVQQNSLKSIQEAYQKNFKIAEFDVRLTQDEIVVLFHDEKYREIQIDQSLFKSFKSAAEKEFPDLSTLEEVFIWLQEKSNADAAFDFKLNIEIKSKKIFNGRLEKKVFELIQKYQLVHRVLISSFNPLSLYRFRKLEPRLYRALLLTRNEESNFILNRMWLNFLALPDVLHLRWNDFSLNEFRASKFKVPVVLWTVNETDQIKSLKQDIFGVISDRITPSLWETLD